MREKRQRVKNHYSININCTPTKYRHYIRPYGRELKSQRYTRIQGPCAPEAYSLQRNKTYEQSIVNSVISTVEDTGETHLKLGKSHGDLEEVAYTSWRKWHMPPGISDL